MSLFAAQDFIAKWDRATLNERATAQEHFIDLCRLLGVPTPNEADPAGSFYRFEKPLTKSGGKAGFADVWRRDRFAWEYKTKGKYPNLQAAYQQLLLYKGDLDNPPVLVACDIATYEVHVDFTGHKSRVERFVNADLANTSTRELLRAVFTDPEQLRPVERVETITEQAAARFAQVAQFLERRGFAPSAIAPFFMKILFGLFAEDIHLLPAQLMSQNIRQAIMKPAEFPDRARALFRAMREGSYFGTERVPQFNGGLFDDDDVLPLNADELQFLADAARLDWSQVEPAIFGTLFERSLDPAKRAQLGAHYTSRSDILLIVEPVLMTPLRRRWAAVHAEVEALRPQWEAATGVSKQQLRGQLEGKLLDFMVELSKVRVLDPACGSGNFLYVALNQLKDLEKEVVNYAAGAGLTVPELGVSPAQLYGIEKNPFAAELAQVVVWIGYLQWKRTNGFWDVHEPILQTLHTIENRDAILEIGEDGKAHEPVWPEADVIVGNPPFLGTKKLRGELGKDYVTALHHLYNNRIPGFSDLVCYWFEKARAEIQNAKVKRSGLLATNSVRLGENRRVLERIKSSGDIFFAHADLPWVLEGATVRISMVGFDNGLEIEKFLDGRMVNNINPDLTASEFEITSAKVLSENKNLAFLGAVKGGSFDIPENIAFEMLQDESNQEGVSNKDVVKKAINAIDIVRLNRRYWIVDFGVDMPLEVARKYIKPFEYVERVVKPERERGKPSRSEWWLHMRPGVSMRNAIGGLQRYIGTPTVSKHRVFVWLQPDILPTHLVVAIARTDDYFFGVLHSRLHELWSIRLGTSLGIGNDPRYTPTTTFETYPFPWPPGQEPADDPRVVAIAEAAQRLVELRDAWLNEAGLDAQALKKRTLTNLYNARPDWLDQAHRQLDQAVLDAYGWPRDIADEEILSRLLALNLERAAAGGAAPATAAEDEEDGGEERE
ncbi:MAG TPA: DNA methyltransferase [Roseiflexaceae bacterium]|nr:DNA methyltransferase [Roseiflexaceae bacterium]